MTRKETILLFILAAINFTHIVDFMILMPLGPTLMKHLHINNQQFGIIVASYSLSAAFSSLATSFFVDQYDRKKVLIIAYTGFLIGTFACAFAPNFMWLTSARIFAGFFGGILGAQVFSIVGDTIVYEKRATAMAYIMAAFSMASVLGVPLGLKLTALWNWHAPFIGVGLLGVLILIFVILFVPNLTAHINKQKVNSFDVLRSIKTNKNQQYALLLSFVLMIGHFIIIPFISTYLVLNLSFNEHNLDLVYFVGGLVTIFTSPIIGKLADKHGKHKLFMIFGFCSVVPIYLLTNLTTTVIYLILTVTGFFFITASGRMIPTQALITSVVSPDKRGGFMSINSFVQQLGSGIASLMGGIIAYKSADNVLVNYDILGYISIAFILLGVLVSTQIKHD